MKTFFTLGVLCLWASFYWAHGLTVTTFLDKEDRIRLKGLFTAAQPYADLASAHFSIHGLKLLGEAIPKSQEACNFIKSQSNGAPLEGLYHAASASAHLGNCPLTLPTAQFEAVIKDDSSLQDLFYSVSGLKALKKPVDSAKLSKILSAALKRDDSVISLGYAFYIASQLTGDVGPFFERIEDATVQADEVNERFLQFEGGLGITATIVSGAFKLAQVAKKAPAITGDQTVKFTNYFVSRKFVQSLKGASQLLDVLQVLATNKYHIPVSVTLASNAAVSSKSPVVQLRVTNVLGESLGPLTVTADSCIRQDDKASLFTKKNLVAVQGDASLYSLNLMENKPLRGFYKISFSAAATKPDPRLVGNTAVPIQVKVMTEIGVENAELGIVDRDQATTAKNTKLTFNQKLKGLLEADHHQKLLLRLSLKDLNTGKPMLAHQVFVSLTHVSTKQEIVFVAEPDSSSNYKFDMDLHVKAKDFQYQSGKYILSLLVGDAVVANPFVWDIADLSLTFQSNPVNVVERADPFAKKPVINHLFREQEIKPSTVVSNAFSALVLLPLLVLLLMWAKLGVNISGFPCTLGAIGYHLGIAGILGLLVCFWLQLNMFTTLKYLSALGVLAFLSGHSMLSAMAGGAKK